MTDTFRASIAVQTQKQDDQITGVRDLIPAHIPCSFWPDFGDRPVADIWLYPGQFCDYPPQPGDPRCPNNGFDGDWTHVAFCLKENTVTYYVNGEPKSIGPRPDISLGPFNAGVNNLFIGRWADGGEYVGGIDDFRIYPRYMSGEEIECLMVPPGNRDPEDIDGDCNVDRYDVMTILSHRNQPANVAPACDLDGDGMITVLDARQCILKCTCPRCVCEGPI